MSQCDVISMGFQTISNVLFFDFEGNMSNVDVKISWKLSFIPLNSGGLWVAPERWAQVKNEESGTFCSFLKLPKNAKKWQKWLNVYASGRGIY